MPRHPNRIFESTILTSIIVGAFRFPLATLGIIEASTTLRFSIPTKILIS